MSLLLHSLVLKAYCQNLCGEYVDLNKFFSSFVNFWLCSQGDVMSNLIIQREIQLSPVADPYSALVALIRPILHGLLYSLKQDVINEIGGYQNLKLKMLPRFRRSSDGDVGICFEYAVHEAIRQKNPMILERVNDALSRHCSVPGRDIESILFGAEKTGALQLIDTAHNILTDNSRVLTGGRHQPPKLKSYLNDIAAAFRLRSYRESLPNSINGLWKADLFLGYTDTDRWVGTTVKINPSSLEGAQGLRIGIVPAHYGFTDRIFFDDNKNLVVCPMPYDGSFMQFFYGAWGVVMQLIDADMNMPKEVNLPNPLDRQVATQLVQRREYTILEVIQSLSPLAQPHLLQNDQSTADVQQGESASLTDSIISPIPSIIV